MIALLLVAGLLIQDPNGPVAPEPQPPASGEPAPARASEAVELSPAADGTGIAAEGAPAAPEHPRPVRTGRATSGRPDCRNLSYADAHPETCGAGLIGGAAAEAAEPPPPLPVAASSEKARAAQPGTVAEKSADAPPSWIRLAAWGAGALLLTSALVFALLRTQLTDTAGVRPVELHGPERQVLTPAALARGARGPGKSRWSIRDGRLILTGPAGTLLNGVRIDRTGDIVSTGDTVRLGGADYRVRIV